MGSNYSILWPFLKNLRYHNFRYTLMMLEPEQKSAGVIAASAGNHALALAYHGGQLSKQTTTQWYQFRCGILKMIDLKKQNFWPKINILKGNHCILRKRGAPIHQKLGMILENKGVQNLKLEKDIFYKKWSPKLIKNSVDFWRRKLTLKVRFWHFLTNHNSL